MFARFDENPAMTLQVIKETKRYGRTDGRTHGQTDNVKTVYPLQTKFAGGITKDYQFTKFNQNILICNISMSHLFTQHKKVRGVHKVKTA